MSHCLFISDAAKEVKVESHVLRYWEEELHLPIKRNELGHRYYTEEDVERFKQIKSMKERGLQLKAIKMILRDGKLDVLPDEDSEGGQERPEPDQSREGTGRQAKESGETAWEGTGRSKESGEGAGMAIEIVDGGGREPGAQGAETALVRSDAAAGMGKMATVSDGKEDKARRLQWLLQQMIMQSLQENNRELCREIKESVIKELDYQFRMQEEREEARDQRLAERDEAYYKRMDELLRKKSRAGKEQKEKDKDKGKILKGKTDKNVRESAALTGRQREKGAEQEDSAGIEFDRLMQEGLDEAIRDKMSEHKKRHFF